MRRIVLASGAALLLLSGAGTLFADSLVDSPHNLSVNGPGPIKSTDETEICIFCHAAHSKGPRTPLWNRRDPGAIYTTYRSSTLKVAPGQPTGASRQCLSCHDGTIALGDVLNRKSQINMGGGADRIPANRTTNIGTDLSGHHPVSFDYSTSLMRGARLVPTPILGKKPLLDEDGAVQCTSCHDPHNNKFGKFLIASNTRSALCTACHQPDGWTTSPHATSPSRWNGTGDNPWPDSKLATVAENACASCHVPHAAKSKERLIRSASLSQLCVTCHNGNVAQKNIAAEVKKWSAHPVGLSTTVHDPAEKIDGRATHVECVDCHDPHQSSDRGGTADLPATLAGVTGMTATGAPIKPAKAEYEVCFKCHSDEMSTNRLRITRQILEPNIRLRFQPGNPSFHPVVARGQNFNVPSLKPPLTTASTIRCTSCHANDSGPGAGGPGPAGPHGSRWDYLLEERYVTADKTVEDPSTYALCYKCHERTSILADQSFKGHSKHIVSQRTPCSVCHDPHGIPSSLGSTTQNGRLINFDTTVVTPNSKRVLSATTFGSGTQCSLMCHGKDHDHLGY